MAVLDDLTVAYIASNKGQGASCRSKSRGRLQCDHPGDVVLTSENEILAYW
ncbi:hypothetical protein [Sulfitobacter sediminilitoris]